MTRIGRPMARLAGRFRRPLLAGLFALFGTFLVWGIIRYEFVQVISNSILLCYSCIGIK